MPPKMKLDRCVAPLVHALNRLPSVETDGSCQGHKDDRLPYVSFMCDEADIWIILKAVNLLNSREPPQVRAYAEIMAYGRGRVDALVRFHHLFLKVKPTRATVREWHRRIREMTQLILRHLEDGRLSALDTKPAFGEPMPLLRLKRSSSSGRQ